MNKLLITGRITKDIELKGNENKFIVNTIAVYMGKDKDKNDITYFFDFKAFNYSANKIHAHCQKGSKIAIEGVLRQDKWEDDNVKYSKVVIYAENIEILADTKEKTDDPSNEEEQNDLPF